MTSNFILDNVSKAIVEKGQTKSLAERGQATSDQTELGQVQPDLIKPLIPERQTVSNQSERPRSRQI